VVQVSCMIRSIPLKHLVMSETTTVVKEHSQWQKEMAKFWNRDAPLSHKKYPQDMIQHHAGMTAARWVETIKVEVHGFANVKLWKGTEQCYSLSSRDVYLIIQNDFRNDIFANIYHKTVFSCYRNCCLSFSISKDTMFGKESARRAQPPPGPQYPDTGNKVTWRQRARDQLIGYPRCHFLYV